MQNNRLKMAWEQERRTLAKIPSDVMLQIMQRIKREQYERYQRMLMIAKNLGVGIMDIAK